MEESGPIKVLAALLQYAPMGSRAGLEVDEGNLLTCHYSAVVRHVTSSLYWSRYSDPILKTIIIEVKKIYFLMLIKIELNQMFVWLCISDIIIINNQLDATIIIY